MFWWIIIIIVFQPNESSHPDEGTFLLFDIAKRCFSDDQKGHPISVGHRGDILSLKVKIFSELTVSYVVCIVTVCRFAAVSDAWSESCVLSATSPDVVGYLHNRLRARSGSDLRQRCGTETRPWIISVLPGQRINITLLDYTVFRGRHVPQTNRKVCLFVPLV